MSEKCVICWGSGYIRLPVIKPVSATYSLDAEMTTPIEDCSRSYRCPECSGGQVADEKILVMYAQDSISAEYSKDSGPLESVKCHIANILAHEFLRRGLIEFIDRKEGELVQIRGRLGVVHPVKVQSLEQRVLDKAERLMDEVVEDASEQIRLWGSYYSGDEGRISKGQAVDAMRGAFARKMAEERA